MNPDFVFSRIFAKNDVEICRAFTFQVRLTGGGCPQKLQVR
jgi:hypothetical protein